MAEEITSKRYAVVTGANKGIGLEICKQLALKGIVVVLTARDKNRGIQALEKLKTEFGELTDFLIFHQLDVADQSSVESFADFLKTQFGKLDILVNNAGIGGSSLDDDDMKTLSADKVTIAQLNWTETYEQTVKCVETNYYGAKRMIEANLPLLQLSESPRIVNVSSSLGLLKNIPNEWAKSKLSDIDNLNEDIIDEVIKKYLQDFKEGALLENKWPVFSAYTISKAAISAYTRVIAKRYPQFCVNCVCPGYVKTDINYNTGNLTVEEGADGPVKLALLPNGGPTGLFFVNNQVVDF